MLPVPRALAIAACVATTTCLLPIPGRAAGPVAWRLLADSPPLPPALKVPFGVNDPVRHPGPGAYSGLTRRGLPSSPEGPLKHLATRSSSSARGGSLRTGAWS